MQTTPLNQEKYRKILESLNSQVPVFDLEAFFESFYEKKMPESLKRYFVPEKRYISRLAKELNSYFIKIGKNIRTSLKKGPKEVLNTRLEDLLFSSPECKEELGKKLRESLEEASYALEIGAVEAYQIWNIKYNLPIIGKIARRRLKKRIGQEDLPSFEYSLDKLDEIKKKACSFLGFMGFDSYPKLSKSEIRDRYHRRMRQEGFNRRRLLEYDYHEKRHTPKNAREVEEKFIEKARTEFSRLEEISNGVTLEDYLNIKRRERQKEFISSDYNSFGEKLISYIGRFFNFLFR